MRRMDSKNAVLFMWRMALRELPIRELFKGVKQNGITREKSALLVAMEKNIRNVIGILMKN